jgi:DNA modification methylase
VIHYQDDWLTVMLGDCRAVMAEMEPESVHTVVTSPPYWGLRDYGTATWEGGAEGCDHLSQPAGGTRNGGRDRAASGGTFHDSPKVEAALAMPYRDVCGKCGAHRIDSQLGLEPTPEAYVESMVAVFREVRRVLRSDGTVWLNLGDSYAATAAGKAYGWTNGKTSERDAETMASYKTVGLPPGLKPKDLVGIPWRVAFALQADGWYLRSDIIWAKPNPMPESVTDRPTKAHEYLFLLSKSPRYYYDADAVREPHTESTLNRVEYGLKHRHPDGIGVGIPPVDTERMGERFANPAGRNMRSVWTIATQPYPGAHFATFPQALVEPCIKAGTSERGVCPECGAPWERIVGREPIDYGMGPADTSNHKSVAANGNARVSARTPTGHSLSKTSATTLGWRRACGCTTPKSIVPATVLDPFAGSGTTGLVAQRLSRRAVLIDLNADYLGQVMDRNRDIPLGLGA